MEQGGGAGGRAEGAGGAREAGEALGGARAAGVKTACGTEDPAVRHGGDARDRWAVVDRGMTPMQALRAATVMGAELIGVADRGRLGLLGVGHCRATHLNHYFRLLGYVEIGEYLPEGYRG